MTGRVSKVGLLLVVLVFLHNTLPHLTMMPRVNVDEPWLMERAYQVMRTGVPSQPMFGLNHAYLLQVGYGYLLACWMAVFGVGLLQARLLSVFLGLGIILMTAWIGRRTIEPITGLSAALFLALDSNFLGGVRSARTDIPSVFFVVSALVAYLRGRQRSHVMWFAGAGAFLGLAVLCHGNAFWAGVVLIAWIFLDYRRSVTAVLCSCAMLGGALLTFGPYLAVVIARWREVQIQIGNYAADRVPSWQPSFVVHQMTQEIERYRGWYFGLVTSSVPNPLLWGFQLAVLAGVIALAVRTLTASSSRQRSPADPLGRARLLILLLASTLIFAGFINNKVPVYLPHLLVGFALVAGFAVSEFASFITAVLQSSSWSILRSRRPAIPTLAALLPIGLYGGAGVAYYEKWYASASKSELVPYEATTSTLRTLVPAGPKYLYASPQFWIPFHAEAGTTFYSFTAAQPIDAGSTVSVPGINANRPIFLLVDEYQWLPELTGPTSSTPAWQRAWVDFIERRCVLDGLALGTAHGTVALFRCGLTSTPPSKMPRIIGGTTEYTVGELVMRQTPADLARWTRYDDPRRTMTARPKVRQNEAGLQISGTGWPGIVKVVAAAPGDSYLVRLQARQTREGDLLYIGTWQQPQVRSLAGASSSGIAASLLGPGWFPRDRAFRAVAAAVRLLVYSEAPETNFVISSLDIYRLLPVPAASNTDP